MDPDRRLHGAAVARGVVGTFFAPRRRAGTSRSSPTPPDPEARAPPCNRRGSRFASILFYCPNKCYDRVTRLGRLSNAAWPPPPTTSSRSVASASTSTRSRTASASRTSRPSQVPRRQRRERRRSPRRGTAHRAALISRAGDDPFGRYVHARAGPARRRRPSSSAPSRTCNTPVTFCEIFPPDDFPLYFYREPKAPDLRDHGAVADLDAIRDARIFWSTVTGLSRGAQPVGALRRVGCPRPPARHRPRPRLPADVLAHAASARPRRCERALEHVTVAVGNREECEVAVGETDPTAPPTRCSTAASSSRSSSRGRKRRARQDPRRDRRGAAVPGRGRQRPRRGRRLRRRALPRPAAGLGPRARPPLRQRRRRDRRPPPRVLDRHAHDRRGRGRTREERRPMSHA